MQRCVRRVWRCAEDNDAGISFEHLKQWVKNTIVHVGARLAAAIHACAVISNHLRQLLEMDPLAPEHWPDEEVAQHWA
ncbi:MAG: hypothetical protein JNN30_20120 [Rhodanobacteraceae bacterium]|nr:hypothetical protein [Rhodanobacteraceae bacterium]